MKGIYFELKWVGKIRIALATPNQIFSQAWLLATILIIKFV